MDSALVIKVKYGDTLRRFNACVDENNQLDLDMVRLRAKILSLFNFSADVNFILRYVDEDGDLVTLMDDDDLRDVMRQRLKFLRIDVHMSCDSGGKSNAMSSGSATPLRSPPVPNQFLSGNVAITADTLKSVPEPLREALSNLFIYFVSKAASSSPVVGTLSDCISKMGQSIPNSDCQPQVAAGLSPTNGVPKEPVTPKGRGSKSTCLDSNSNASQQLEAGNVTGGVVTGASPVNLNILPCDPCTFQSTNVNTAPLSSAVPDDDGKKGKASTDDSFTGDGDGRKTSTSYAAPDNCSTQTTAMGFSPFVECPFSGACVIDSVAPSFENRPIHPIKRSHGHKDAAVGIFHKGVICDGCGVYPITGPRYKSKVKVNYDLCSICVNKMGDETDYIRMDRPVSVHAPQSCKFNGVYEHQQQPLMAPPPLPHLFGTGAISKNRRPKLDSRFVLDVNVIDGTMMAPSTAFTKIWRMRNIGTSVWPKGTRLVWIGGNKFSDSRSVDLEVPEDGLPVDKELDIAVDFRAPPLPGRYISYWRMAYPSGQKFGQCVWVLIQVDASLNDSFYDSCQSLNLNIPLDVSGSNGPKVIDINVQPIIDDAFFETYNSSAPTEPVNQMVEEQPRQELKNNFPIDESTFVGHSVPPAATSAAPLSVSYPIVDISEIAAASALTEPVKQMVDEQPRQQLKNNFPKDEPTLIGHSVLPTATSVKPFSVSYPIIDISETAPAVPSNQQSSVSYPIIDISETAPAIPSNQQSLADALSSSLVIGGNNSVEGTLLRELEEMGFKQVALNKEILRMNEYNLEQSVDDLCGVSEWDPILAELQEMGFHDNEMNKRLLKKNNGSIKRVVMDLINEEKV